MAGQDTLRYKLVKGELMPLSFVFGRTIGNVAADLIIDQLQTAFDYVGAELVVEDAEFTQVLADYNRQNEERQYDLSFLATNFVSTFDAYYHFADDARLKSVNLSGVQDEDLTNLAWAMHIT